MGRVHAPSPSAIQTATWSLSFLLPLRHELGIALRLRNCQGSADDQLRCHKTIGWFRASKAPKVALLFKASVATYGMGVRKCTRHLFLLDSLGRRDVSHAYHMTSPINLRPAGPDIPPVAPPPRHPAPRPPPRRCARPARQDPRPRPRGPQRRLVWGR